MERKSTWVEVGNKLVYRGRGVPKVVEIVRVAKGARSFWVSGLRKGEDRFVSSYVFDWGENAGRAEVSRGGACEWGRGGRRWSGPQVYPWAGETDESLQSEYDTAQAKADKVKADREAARETVHREKLAALKAANPTLELVPLIDELSILNMVDSRGNRRRLIVAIELGEEVNWNTLETEKVLKANVTERRGGSFSSWSERAAYTEEELIEKIAIDAWWG